MSEGESPQTSREPEAKAAPEPAAEATTEPTLSLEALQEALEQERARAQDRLAGWQRAQADYQNLKRRLEKERDETAIVANALLVARLLPVLDDLERALAQVTPKLRGFTWVDGIALIHQKLLVTLGALGLSPIEAAGKDFDPALHEAALYQEGEDGKVLEEIQRGYIFRDRIIRPALVKVGRGATTEPAQPADEATEKPQES
ncbi:MAG: nucleotide exchange factor GrpE [Chloroflexi bacterium]|nr:nucleotide exchange factor GrpE [Chloroflexota bacterium]